MKDRTNEVVRRERPVAGLLRLAGATRDDVSSIQLRDVLPGLANSLAGNWDAIGFSNESDARAALERVRMKVRMMEPGDIVGMLTRHGLTADILGVTGPEAAGELAKIHHTQSMEGKDIALRRGAAAFVVLLAAPLTDRMYNINKIAYQFVKRDPAMGVLAEREDFLSLQEFLKRAYLKGAQAAHGEDPALIGFMYAACEVANGIRRMQERQQE